MPQWFKDFWAGLDRTMRIMVMAAGIMVMAAAIIVVLALLWILATGTGGWSAWLQGRF